MPLDTHIYKNGNSFLARAQKFLEKNESLNNLILGVSMRLRDQPGWYKTQPYLATIETLNGQILIAALMTPPYQMVLSGAENVDQEAIDVLVQNLESEGMRPPGVNGQAQLSERFAQAWTDAIPFALYRVSMRERAYELRHVNPIRYSPGSLQTAKLTDLEKAVEWHEAFLAESLPDSPSENSRDVITRMISNDDVYFWEDGGPVSMAVRTRPTPHGYTVSGVYTPPNMRRRGYATSCVAALSQRLLEQGKDFCNLFTDLSNPTSNAIYKQIGYHPVGDFTVFQFDYRNEDESEQAVL